MKKPIEKLASLYRSLKHRNPPEGALVNGYKDWHDGFYRGRLSALEMVCEEVFGVPVIEIIPKEDK